MILAIITNILKMFSGMIINSILAVLLSPVYLKNLIVSGLDYLKGLIKKDEHPRTVEAIEEAEKIIEAKPAEELAPSKPGDK